MAISGTALGSVLAGSLLVYAGIRGVSLGAAVQAVVQGKSPATVPGTRPITGSPAGAGPSATSVPVTATGATIANDAVQYQGHAYLYGGAPGADGAGPWDCSSFCNWVLGHDVGFTLPGRGTPGYDGSSHGPTTLSYLGWGQAMTVSHSAGDAQAGDLCVWQTHMGIALGGGQMISALNPSLGTRVTSITGGAPGGELLFVRRIVIGTPHA